MLFTNGKNTNHVGYTTDIITGQALDWLDQRDEKKPFFLMCQHKAPHGKWEPALRHLHEFDHMEGVNFSDHVSQLKLDMALKSLNKRARKYLKNYVKQNL